MIYPKKDPEHNRYDTIDLDDDDAVEIDSDEYDDDEDDVNNKNLDWKIDCVGKEVDDEKLIDDNIADVAMEIIMGHKKGRGHKKNQEQITESKRKEFDPNDDLISAFFQDKTDKLKTQNENSQKLNHDLLEIRDYEDDKSLDEQKDSVQEDDENEDDVTESDQYYDNNYWQNPYASNFKIEDLLLE